MFNFINDFKNINPIENISDIISLINSLDSKEMK